MKVGWDCIQLGEESKRGAESNRKKKCNGILLICGCTGQWSH